MILNESTSVIKALPIVQFTSLSEIMNAHLAWIEI